MPQNNRFNRASGSNNLPQKNKPTSEELLHYFLTNQKEGIRLRQQEIELKEKKLSQTHELALKKIKLQAEHLQTAPG